MADAEYRHCVRCGTPYTPKHKIAMYCGNACKVAAHRAARPDLDQQRRAKAEAERLRAYTPAEPRLPIHSAHVRGWKRKKDIYDARQAFSSKPCLTCASPVGYIMGGSPRIYCSEECRPVSDCERELRRGYKKARRAKTKGAHAENIKPSDIFDRDGWRCQMCGIQTPKSSRGTYRRNAPELDHVTPLSRGGTHTWQNLQCLCRPCNAWKSDRIIPAQSGLFSDLCGEGRGKSQTAFPS